MTTSRTEDSESTIDIDWVRTLAAALAAVSSAVMLSTLGAVGTIIGAALGSLIASVGTAVYAQGLARSKERVARAQNTAMHRISLAQGEVRRAQDGGVGTMTQEAHLEQAGADLEAAGRQLDNATPEAEMPPWRERLVLLPWKRIGIFAAGVFLVAVVVISSFELLSGRSVSSYTGGADQSSRTTFFGGAGQVEQREQREQQEAPDQQQEGPGQPGQAPDDEADPEDSSTPTDDTGPSEDPVEEPAPSEEPTEEPTTPAPSPTPVAPTTPAVPSPTG